MIKQQMKLREKQGGGRKIKAKKGKAKPPMASRVKLLEVSAQTVIDLCKMVAENKLPKDASVLRVTCNAITNNFDFIIQSKEFEPVPEGAWLPKVNGSPILSHSYLIKSGKRRQKKNENRDR